MLTSLTENQLRPRASAHSQGRTRRHNHRVHALEEAAISSTDNIFIVCRRINNYATATELYARPCMAENPSVP